MDTDTSWQAFACTGNIYRYLDYKQQAEAPAANAEEEPDGTVSDVGARAERDPL